SILPVKWLNVSGAVQSEDIVIKWATAQEINTESFTIQVSSDGKKFKNAGEVAAAGNSNENSYYSFVHTQPVSGNNFYRIMQTDADGKITYSKIIMIVYGDPSLITILGNPVDNGQLIVQVNQTTSLKLFSADGKLVKMQQASNGTQSIDVRGLPKGMYTLLAGSTAKRIIINN
ncbi:MAG TPA: T9SS type A sorting domain-containing protein, partial [Flavisolibacter sp.]|nr:T9SS type A sorting domain-containing protein [Flavisolibacter sp.]